MTNFTSALLICLLFSLTACAQRKPLPPSNKITTTPSPTAATRIDKGTVDGLTYSNRTFKFSVTFPDTWQIAGEGFEEQMRKHGIDLSLKAPSELVPASRTTVNKALKNISVLVTAFRPAAGKGSGAILRISAEDLMADPQIKDAVDYCDAVRSTYRSIRLPPDFRYSETQAEKLGSKQFAFLDISTRAGKKRMYVTVRDRHALLFTLSYRNAEDLETAREILIEGDFALQ